MINPQSSLARMKHIFPADVQYRGKDCRESKRMANNSKFSFLSFLFFFFFSFWGWGQYAFPLKIGGLQRGRKPATINLLLPLAF